jgi:hypothetical protein
VKRLVLAALALGTAACAPELAPGEWGIFRYAGNVFGVTPLDLVPPISDREGNYYLLYGADKSPKNKPQLFIGYRGGVWDGGCAVTQGMGFGPHGFVGRAQNQAWYWSGEGLVGASAFSGGCEQILPSDPNSGAKLSFIAVVPFVRETPSKLSLVAWVQSPGDDRPFVVLVDLNASVFRSVVELAPNTLTNVTVLGVGADPDTSEGVVLFSYKLGEQLRVEARFYDADAAETGRLLLSGLDDLGAYDIVGYFERSTEGVWAGLDRKGQLLMFDRKGGQRRAITNFTPVGVHRFDGELYLVGTSGQTPVAAPIDPSGKLGAPKTWQVSVDAARALGSTIEVIDDRTLPSRRTAWSNPRTAMGAFPFLHAHSPHRYADQTTLWLVAGPTLKSGGVDRTAIACAPVGIAYP